VALAAGPPVLFFDRVVFDRVVFDRIVFEFCRF
jgi:hypothetical protein